MRSFNITSTLFEMAGRRPGEFALAFPARPAKAVPRKGPIPYEQISFRELREETLRLVRGLHAGGFNRGDRVVVMVPPGPEFFYLLYAFIYMGIIPVLIDPGMGIKFLKQCIDETEPIGFIGVSKAHAARVLLNWGRAGIKKKVTLGPRLFWGGISLDTLRKAGGSGRTPAAYSPHPDDLASIAFTSGSTGLPKGVMNTHGILCRQAEVIRDTFDIRPGEIDLPTFPPFALLNPVLGVSTVIPLMDASRPAMADPGLIIRTLRQFGVTSMFASPVLLDRLGRYGQACGIRLPQLRRVLTAGAPVPARALRRFSEMLEPGVQLFTPYGATEAMPVASIGSHEILRDEVQQVTASGGGICIGKTVQGLESRLIRISDEAIPAWKEDLEVEDGDVGEIVVRGKHVTRAYFKREEATRMAKIHDGNTIWHRMGDLAYRDTAGRLWFCGRKAHRVPLADKELYTVPCESILNLHPMVRRTALVGVRGKAVLCVELERQATGRIDRRQVRKDLLALAAGNEITKDIQTVLFHPSFPVDIRHNAKIFREKLAAWAASRMSPPWSFLPFSRT